MGYLFRPLYTIQAASIHRLQYKLMGSLIPVATYTFVGQRQLLPKSPPSPLEFLLIFTHFTAKLGILRFSI